MVFFTVAQAADAIKMSAAWVRREAASVGAQRVGRDWIITDAQVESLRGKVKPVGRPAYMYAIIYEPWEADATVSSTHASKTAAEKKVAENYKRFHRSNGENSYGHKWTAVMRDNSGNWVECGGEPMVARRWDADLNELEPIEY